MIAGIGTDIIEIARLAWAAKKDRFLKKCFTDAELAQIGAKKHRGTLGAETSAFRAEAVAFRAEAVAFRAEAVAFRLAGIFAAKEAVAKALGVGFSGFTPRDIEILREENGRPTVKLHKGAQKRAKTLAIARIHVTISHERAYAVAFALAETSSMRTASKH